VFQSNRCASIELKTLHCFIFKLEDSKQTVTMLQGKHSNFERRDARAARTVRSYHSIARYRYTRTRSFPRPVSVSVGTGGFGHAGNVADLGRAARSKALFSLQINAKNTYTCIITLLRIWPDVETFRMSFCGDPCSCSGSLSDDSASAAAAAASTAAILSSSPRDSHTHTHTHARTDVF